MKIFYSFFSFLLGFAWVSKAASPEDQADLPDVRISSSLAWIEAANEASGDSELGAPHPLTQRMQFWADALDQKLRVQLENRPIMDGVPRPRIRLAKSPSLNAFASSGSACFKVPLRIKGAQRTGNHRSTVVSISSSGKVGFYSEDEVACLDGGPKSAEEVLAFYRENLWLGPCRLELDGRFLALGAGCRLEPRAPSEAQAVVVNAQIPWITLNLGLVRLFEEESHLVYALLHELAHYYRAHGALNKKAYDYFYRLEPIQLKPRPDPTLDPLGQQLLKLPSYRIAAVKGQLWHSEIFAYARYAFNHLVKPACRDASVACFQVCRPLEEILDSPESQALFGRFPAIALKEEASELYFKWETAFTSCLKAIPVGTDKPEPGTGQVSLKAAQEVFWWSEAENGELFHIAQSMNQKFFGRDREHAELLQQALDEQLGYYTSEEEADILALRWMALLGIEVQAAVDHWLQYGDAVSVHHGTSAFNFGSARCRALYEAEPRWSEGGQPVAIPVGIFSQPHHSSCFRAWRMERAVAGFAWKLGPSLWAKAASVGGSYAALREEVLQIPIGFQ